MLHLGRSGVRPAVDKLAVERAVRRLLAERKERGAEVWDQVMVKPELRLLETRVALLVIVPENVRIETGVCGDHGL